MEGIFLGQAVDGVFSIDKTKLTFEDDSRTHESHSTIRYSDCDYVLVESDDVIKTNDELLKLRDKVTKLEAELTEIKTTRTLREAYIAGVEKGCESLREDRDTWKRRWNSVVTDIGKSLEANGITFVFKEIHGNGNWDVVIDIPELNEAKKKVDDLEKKLKAAESKETFWRDRKEEEEDYHHYWLHTYDRVVKQAAEKGIHIGVRGNDEECNAGIVVVDNVKAEELEKQVVQMEDANQKLRQRISAADEEIEELKNREGIAYWRNTYYSAVKKAKAEGVTIVMQGMDFDRNVAHIKVMNHRTANLERRIKRLEDDVVAAKDRGDYWKRSYDDLAEYLDNTRKDLVARGKTVGVKIEFKGDKSDSNVGDFDITNEKTIELMVKVSDTKHEYNKKWQAMFDALKDKGVEVIYMGEQDGKPIIDIKVPEIDILRKDFVTRGQELEDLRKENQNLGDSYSKLKKDFEALNASYINRGSRIECLELDLKDNKYKDNKYEKLFKHACDMKDYWYSTYYEAVRQSWSQGVSIRIDKVNFKDNVGIVQVNNERAEELKREIEDLKSKKVAACTLESGADGRLKFIYTYMDGHNEPVDADSISHGTIPKCKSCVHYMHNPSRYAHDWCYMPVPKEGGAGYIRKLNKEEVEGPACGDFKARKE